MRTALEMTEKRDGTSVSKKRAFTLPDLLATIAGCAVLLVLVLPAIGRSKDGGRGAVCTNNLRQMGVALNLYASDNKDWLALPNWGYQSTGWLFSRSITNPDTVSDVSDAYKSGVWFPYVRTPATYICPVDREEDSNRASRNNRLSSYSMNGAACSFGGSSGRKITEAWSPNCYLLWEPDVGLGEYVYNDGAAYPGPNSMAFENIGRNHMPSSAEVLTLSGNVTPVAASDFVKEAYKASSSLVIW